MTVSLKHSFIDNIPDNPAAVAAGEVVPSNWNAQHNLTGTANTMLGFDVSGNAVELTTPPAVSSITRNYNGGSGAPDTVAVGGWESSANTAFFHIEFHPPLAQNVSTLTFSALSDFGIYDSKSSTTQAVTSIVLGTGGKNGCYIRAGIASAIASPGVMAELVAVTTSASLTFS